MGTTLTGTVLGARILAALLIAAPAFAGAACADVSVVNTEVGPAPTLLSIEPATGPTAGGTPVVLLGRDFDEKATVRFGGKLATDVKWVDAQTLNAVTPPGTGVVSVSVENENQRVDTLEESFTYEGASGGCAVIAGAPDLGASDIPVTGELHLTYSAPINAASLGDAVQLRHLGTNETVPVQVLVSADTGAEIIVRPQHSLRFWSSYAVLTTAGVQAADGSSCAPAALAFATLAPTALPRPLRAAQLTGIALKGDTILGASETYRGLQLFDTTAPEGAKLTSDVPTSFGPRTVVVHGDRAYVPSVFEGVQIFDVTDPTAPKWLGHGGTPGRAVDVAVLEKNSKTYLIVADTEGGARVLDATNPTSVTEIGPLDLGGGKRNVSSVDVDGDRIAIAEDTRFRILDLPDPSNLSTQVLHATVNINFLVSDVLLSEGRLYIGRSTFGVASYDLATPAAPVLLSQADDPDGPCPSACKHIASRLVKDGSELFVAYARGGVMAYSIDAKGLLTPGKVYQVEGDVRSVAVSPTRVFAGGEEGLVVFDRTGDGTKPLWFDANGHGRARTVFVHDDHAYVGALLRGVQTFSLADPESPQLVDRDDTPASLTADDAAFGVAAEDGVLAVGDGRAGVTLFDLKDPANPVLGGTYDTTDAVRSIASAGHIVYACNDNAGLVTVDAADPANPLLLGEVAFDDIEGFDACRDVTPAGDLAYVGRLNGLGVLDVADPSAPAWLTLVPMPGNEGVTGVRKLGAHLLVTTGRFDYEGEENNTSRLHVFSLATPASPALIWSSPPLERASGIAIAGDIAFIPAGNFGVKVYDLSDITAPVYEGSIPTPGTAAFAAVGKDVVYVVQGAGGLQALHTGPLPQPKP
ncbi:MAG: IPT/TIG domain-containing protein [Polyangiaceae bacterium]